MGGSDWLIGKNHDTFGPLGTYIVPKEFFKDPALRGLIDVALENNRDLRVAALNVVTSSSVGASKRSGRASDGASRCRPT